MRNETHRFEKKMVNREADDSGFCVSIGVLGADPRRHAFSYDVSASKIKILSTFKYLWNFFNLSSCISSKQPEEINSIHSSVNKRF